MSLHQRDRGRRGLIPAPAARLLTQRKRNTHNTHTALFIDGIVSLSADLALVLTYKVHVHKSNKVSRVLRRMRLPRLIRRLCESHLTNLITRRLQVIICPSHPSIRDTLRCTTRTLPYFVRPVSHLRLYLTFASELNPSQQVHLSLTYLR